MNDEPAREAEVTADNPHDPFGMGRIDSVTVKSPPTVDVQSGWDDKPVPPDQWDVKLGMRIADAPDTVDSVSVSSLTMDAFLEELSAKGPVRMEVGPMTIIIPEKP